MEFYYRRNMDMASLRGTISAFKQNMLWRYIRHDVVSGPTMEINDMHNGHKDLQKVFHDIKNSEYFYYNLAAAILFICLCALIVRRCTISVSASTTPSTSSILPIPTVQPTPPIVNIYQQVGHVAVASVKY